MHKLFYLSLILLLPSFSGTGYSQTGFSQTASSQTATAEVTNFTLPDLSGQLHALEEWRGQVLVVNFWATWCPPCLKEIPEFIDLQKTMGSQGLQFIGVAIDQEAPVKKFIATHHVNYPMLIAGDEGIQMTLALGNRTGGLPFTIIIDRQGQIRHRHAGILSKQQVLELVQPLLKRAH